MAWRFRKNIKLGPLRLNLSKSGVGTSIGVRGFRVGTDAKGRSYTAASIPGTGLYSRTYSSQGRAASGDAAGLPGAATASGNGTGLAVGMLALAFMAGGLVVFVLMPPPFDSTSGGKCPCSASGAYPCEAAAGPSLKAGCGSSGSATVRNTGNRRAAYTPEVGPACAGHR